MAIYTFVGVKDPAYWSLDRLVVGANPDGSVKSIARGESTDLDAATHKYLSQRFKLVEGTGIAPDPIVDPYGGEGTAGPPGPPGIPGPPGPPGESVAGSSAPPPLSVALFGHSYLDQPSAISGNKRAGAQLCARLRAYEHHHAIGGARLTWHTVGNPDAAPQSGDGGWPHLFQKFTGTPDALVFYYGINDLSHLGPIDASNADVNLLPFKLAMRAALRRLRSIYVIESSVTTGTARFNFPTGTWSTVANTKINSGANYRKISSATGSFEIVLPSTYPGTPVNVGTVMTPQSAGRTGTPLGGATWTFSENGVPIVLPAQDGVSGSAFDDRTLWKIPNHATAGPIYGPGSVNLGSFSPGAHTIRCDITNVAGGNAFVDYAQWRDTVTPPILIPLVTRPAFSGAYAAQGFRDPVDSEIPFINAVIQSVAAEFDNTVVLDHDPLFNKNAALFQTDGLHPTEEGHRMMASSMFQAVQALDVDYMRDTSAAYGAVRIGNETVKHGTTGPRRVAAMDGSGAVVGFLPAYATLYLDDRTVVATTPGTVTGKLALLDANGNVAGYLPIYNQIT